MLKPIGKRLLVIQIPIVESPEGIVLPQSYNDKVGNNYRIIAVSEQCDKELKPGSQIILDSRRLQIGNHQQPQLIDEEQVLAIL